MKKFFSLFAALLLAGSMMADSYTITFKDAGAGKGDSSTSLTSTNVADYVADGAAYVSAIAVSGKVYNGQDGYGLKFGNSSNPGSVTLTLAAAVTPTSIVMNASPWSATEGAGLLQDSVFATTSTGAKGTFANFTYIYDGATQVTTIVVGTSTKRGYVKSITVNYGEVVPPTPTMDYYVVGSMTSWAANANYKLVANPATEGEYMGKFTFAANAEFKVAYSDGTTIEDANWFPTGMDNNFQITEAGEYNVYFRPDGQGGEGWHYGFIYAAPIVPKTCAEVYNMAKNDEVVLNDVTVTYVNGKNVYVKDASGSMLLYLSANATWQAGDVLSGVEGKVDIYSNLYEVKPSADQVAAVTATAGEAPAPVEMAAAPVAADMNKYVIFKNVSVAAGEFTTSSATNLDMTIGEGTVVLRNAFKLAKTFEAGKTYNVVGACAVYNSTVQVYFISAEEVVDPRMAGTYTIGGEGADYAKLSDAIIALEANGMRGDVDLVICADLAENVNVGITNNTDYTLTIRPNAAVKRTIQYGDQDDNAGPSGHIIIGEKMALGWNDALATKNVVIDGSFEGEGQYLEFRGGAIGGVVIVLYGKLTNSVVKNCRIINPRTSGTTYAVHFRSETSSDNAPEGVGFENCYIEVTGVSNAQAVYFNGSQSATAAGKPKDCYLKGCEIVSNLRGVFFNGAINATFEGNTFRLPSASAGFLAHGIMGNVQKGTIIVRGNKFIELGTMNTSPNEYGICGITASGGSDVWIIENNYFAGLDSKADITGKIVTLRYVRCGDSCVVRHNSFYLPAQTYKPATDLVASQAVTCLWLAGAKAYPVENNIFVSAETVAKNSLIRGALNENVKNNVFFHNGGEAAILAGAVVAADSTAFFADGANAGSKWKLPVFANAAIGDLAITTADADLQMPRMADVLVDIMGSERRENTYAGAFEGPEPGQGTSLDMTEVEGVEKIFRNGQVLIIKNGKTYNMMGQVVE